MRSGGKTRQRLGRFRVGYRSPGQAQDDDLPEREVGLKEAVRAGGRAAQSCESACVWREARVAKLYQDLYRQVVPAFKAPKAPSASAKSVQAYHLQVQPSEHILGLFRPLRPSSCTRWVAVGLNVLHTALPLTCQLGVCTSCSRALDWVCLPARRSGSPSHAPVAARPLCVWLTLDGGTNTQCSPNAHPMLTHSLARSLFGQPRHGWNSLLQKLSLAASGRKGLWSWVAVIGAVGGREEGFLRLTRTWGPGGPSSMLVCRANPPVWSCRVGRLPAMQLDGRATVERGGIRSLVFQPPGSNLAATGAEAQSW